MCLLFFAAFAVAVTALKLELNGFAAVGAGNRFICHKHITVNINLISALFAGDFVAIVIIEIILVIVIEVFIVIHIKILFNSAEILVKLVNQIFKVGNIGANVLNFLNNIAESLNNSLQKLAFLFGSVNIKTVRKTCDI